MQHGDAYGFEPAEITIYPGDVVRFITTGSQPESVVFSADSATPEAAAYIRASGLDRGVLLTEPGSAHDISFRDAPVGKYPFQSIPHADHGMRGAVEVARPAG